MYNKNELCQLPFCLSSYFSFNRSLCSHLQRFYMVWKAKLVLFQANWDRLGVSYFSRNFLLWCKYPQQTASAICSKWIVNCNHIIVWNKLFILRDFVALPVRWITRHRVQWGVSLCVSTRWWWRLIMAYLALLSHFGCAHTGQQYKGGLWTHLPSLITIQLHRRRVKSPPTYLPKAEWSLSNIIWHCFLCARAVWPLCTHRAVRCWQGSD